MNRKVHLDYSYSLIPVKDFMITAKQLQPEIKQLNAASKKMYSDEHASINLPFDTEAVEKIVECVKRKKQLNPKYLVVVGIGGSNLGTMALQEAVLGKIYNQLNPDIKVLYADTVDADKIQRICSLIEPVLQQGEPVLLNLISKSGGTTETIANFEILSALIKKYMENMEDYIVVTSNKNSKLWKYGIDNGFTVLEIPKKIGGRYSVFSAVGLFPLALLGVDISSLLRGARMMRDECLKSDVLQNPAALSAALIYQHKVKGIRIHELFLFSTDLESLGKWYRQLMGESIGKQYDKDGNQVFEGITPMVSIGSTDLHSMAQLDLGGPYDKFTTFVAVDHMNSKMQVPSGGECSSLVQEIQGRSLHEIMQAIFHGVQAAFQKSSRPFVTIVLPNKTPYSLGQFMQMKMMEIMYLGFLMNVNPFDQPNVESYKSETKKILA